MHRRALIPILVCALAGLAAADSAPAVTPAPAAGVSETLPVTRADGDLKVTITGLSLMQPPGGGDPEDENEASWTRVNIKMDWGGKAMKEWIPAGITLADPRGKSYVPNRTSSMLGKDGVGFVAFSGPLWSSAEPWKVRLQFARTSPFQSYEFWNTFTPEEILTVRALPVPEPGKVVAVGKVAEAQGAKVQLIGIAGANTEMPDGIPVKFPSPTLHYRVEKPKDVHVTFLRASDASGEVIPTKAAAMGQGRQGERYAKELLVPNGVQEVYLAFGVHKSRTFEFSAVPSGN